MVSSRDDVPRRWPGSRARPDSRPLDTHRLSERSRRTGAAFDSVVALNCDVSGFVTRRAAPANLERAIRNDPRFRRLCSFANRARERQLVRFYPAGFVRICASRWERTRGRHSAVTLPHLKELLGGRALSVTPLAHGLKELSDLVPTRHAWGRSYLYSQTLHQRKAVA